MSDAQQDSLPVVLTLAGLDPSGGAGMQADIETIISMGVHAAAIATALTVQDSQRLYRFEAVDSLLIIEQARTILEDMPVDAIKIGMLGSVENIEAIHTILRDYPDIPVVLDPILAAGGGGEMSDEIAQDAMVDLLFPEVSLLTPNSIEARRLCPEADTLDACAEELQDMGCEFVLITGTHENTPQVHNTFYGNHRKLETFSWERLPHSYHGSGCTLSSAIAAMLAQGMEMFTAVHEAQEFTHEALQAAFRPGMGQHFPNRLFWARGEED